MWKINLKKGRIYLKNTGIKFIYTLLLISLSVAILFELNQKNIGTNLSTVLLLVNPVLLMVSSQLSQENEKSLLKWLGLFFLLTIMFILEIGSLLGRATTPNPLFNILTLMSYIGILKMNQHQATKQPFFAIKIWTYILAILYLVFSLGIYVFPVGNIGVSNLNTVILVVVTLLLQLSLLLSSFQYIREKIVSAKAKRIFIGVLLGLAVVMSLAVGMLNKTNEFQLTAQILLYLQVVVLIFLSLESIYTGLSTYFKTYQKVFLYFTAVLPIIFLIQNKLWEVAYFKEISGFILDKVAFFAIVFSVLVFIYYTIETVLLWYAYSTKSYTRDLKDVEIETQYRIIVLIPCMNEELVIKNTVKSLLATNYDKLEVYVIDDASSDNTALEVSEFLEDKKFNLLQRVKPEAQIGKGEALNWAYNQIIESYLEKGYIFEETLITIIDADSSVEADYFDKVNRVFNSDFELTGLQSKVQIINRNQDTSQDLEFEEIINATQSLRSKTNTVAFGGNGQFCKLSTMYSLHEVPWTKSLVEDFDLSLRLFLSEIYNVRNVQYDDIKITQTGIYNDSAALVKQRVRWAQGNIQTAKYLPKIIQSKNLEFKQKLEFCFTLIKPWLMTIEYFVIIYTGMMLAGTLILNGFVPAIQMWVLLFSIMMVYIAMINIVWSILYNKNTQEKIRIRNVLKDAYYLMKFLLILIQIYPQAMLRYFKSQNSWDKTKRQA